MSIPQPHMPPVRGTLQRVRPWAAASSVARGGRDHWHSRLSRFERRRLVELLRRSRGRPRTLSAPEHAELHRLVHQLDLGGLVERVVPHGSADATPRWTRGR